MKPKSLVLLAVAGGFGLVAMLGVMQVLNGQAGPEPTVRVLVATADVQSGMPLDEKVVAFKELPQSAVPAGAVTREEEYKGKAYVARALPGEVIMVAKLGGEESITASHQIPKGMRVATVSVNATKSHSGLIRPTDRVDVICTYKMTDMNRRQSTRVKTVLEFIEVFAVDSVRAGREGEVDSAVKNVSLVVDPEQFQLIKAAEEMGDLDLSLRNRNDKAVVDVAELNDSTFLGATTSAGDRSAEPGPAAAVAQAPAGPDVKEFLSTALTAAMAGMSQPTAETDAAEPPVWPVAIQGVGGGVSFQDVLDVTRLPEGATAEEVQRMRAQVESKQKPGANPVRPAARSTRPAARPSAPAAETTPPAQAAASAPSGPALVAPPAFLPPALPSGKAGL